MVKLRGVTHGDEMPRRLPKYCFEDEDRHGNIRIYFRRRKGDKKIRLRGTPFTEPFMEAYDAAKAGVANIGRVRHGTWEWLCREYFASGGFMRLASRTQLIRRRRLTATFSEPIRPGAVELFGDCPLRAIGPKAVEALRDRLCATPEAANERLKAMRQVLAFGVRREDLARNAAKDIPYISSVTEGFYTWTPEDVETFEAAYAPGSKERRALALLLYAGPRRSDVVRFGRQMIRDGWLSYRPVKTPKVLVEIPVLPHLQAELDMGPKNALTFLETEFGKPYTANGFGNWFKRKCRDAGLPNCSAHGLRKAGAVILAERGATDAQMMAIYGWSAVKTVGTYRRKANRKKMAGDAMHLLGGEKLKIS